MKKRITALVLAVVLIIGMSCVGAFAKDDVTEVSIDNIYKLTYLAWRALRMPSLRQTRPP